MDDSILLYPVGILSAWAGISTWKKDNDASLAMKAALVAGICGGVSVWVLSDLGLSSQLTIIASLPLGMTFACYFLGM